MANRSWTLEECINHFNEQEEQIRQCMKSGEAYKQCLDKDAFGGSCYDPVKVVTSTGFLFLFPHQNTTTENTSPFIS